MALKNRWVMAPMAVLAADGDGYPTRQMIDYYNERAKGGAGMIIVGAHWILREYAFPYCALLGDDSYIPKQKELVDAIHAHGCKTFVQLAPFIIRVNAIAPGTIATASAAYLGDRDDNARKRAPLGRAGRVEDLTPAAIFLASDASKYITGVTIETTGGSPFSAFFLQEAKGEWAAAEKKAREQT